MSRQKTAKTTITAKPIIPNIGLLNHTFLILATIIITFTLAHFASQLFNQYGEPPLAVGGTGTINQLDQWKGTSTPFDAVTTNVPGKNIYLPNSAATTSHLTATTICFTGDTCETQWPSGGGGAAASSSIIEVDGTQVNSGVPTLDFDGTMFSLAESPSDDFDITIASVAGVTGADEDDLTDDSIEALSDVASFTQSTGDVLYWNGSAWTTTATTSWDTDTTLDENTVEGYIFDADAETISGNWVNTANPWEDNEVSDTITVGASGSVNVNALPSANALDSELHSALTIAGEDFLSLADQELTAIAINPDNLASADFGDFTCNGTSCSLDATYLQNIVEDTTPQLGANLDGQTNELLNIGALAIGTSTATRLIDVRGNYSGGIAQFTRTPTGASDIVYGTFNIKAVHDGNMGDGFGSALQFMIEDTSSGEEVIADIRGVRSGADNSGQLRFITFSAGSPFSALTLDSSQMATFFGDISLNSAVDINFGNASGFELPNGINPTIDLGGEIAIDTGTSSIRFHDGTAERQLKDEWSWGATFASSSLAFDGDFGSGTGSTTLRRAGFKYGVTHTEYYCQLNPDATGSVVLVVGDGMSTSSPMTCDSSGTTQSAPSNAGFLSRETIVIEIGSVDPGSVTDIYFDATARWTID